MQVCIEISQEELDKLRKFLQRRVMMVEIEFDSANIADVISTRVLNAGLVVHIGKEGNK